MALFPNGVTPWLFCFRVHVGSAPRFGTLDPFVAQFNATFSDQMINRANEHCQIVRRYETYRVSVYRMSLQLDWTLTDIWETHPGLFGGRRHTALDLAGARELAFECIIVANYPRLIFSILFWCIVDSSTDKYHRPRAFFKVLQVVATLSECALPNEHITIAVPRRRECWRTLLTS